MIRFHEYVGYVVFIVSLLLALWNIYRLTSGRSVRSYRPVLVGLIDLQVLIGIITFIVHPVWGRFLVHPILMLVALIVAHTTLRDARSKQSQLTGYIVIVILIALGMFVKW